MRKSLRYAFIIACLYTICINTYAQKLFLQSFERENSTENYIKKNEASFRDSISIVSELEKKLYKNLSKGYILAGYDSIIWKNKQVEAYFTRNDIYIWENLDYSNISKDLNKNHLKFPKKNHKFNADVLLKAIYRALEKNSDMGYPFSKITIDSLFFNKNKVSAILNIDKGDKYYFDSIIIKGNSRLNNYYFQKLTNIKKGDSYSNSKITKLNSHINSVKFIKQSNDFHLAFRDDKISILLYIEDNKLSFFNGIIGIAPNHKTTNKVLITGDLDLSLINTLGYGESFELKWQKFESFSQNLDTKISVPYILKTNFGLGSNFYLEKRDSSYLNTDVSAIIIYGNNLTTGFEVFYRNKSSFIINSENLNQENISDYTTNLIGLKYKLTNTDDKINHRKGFILKTSFGIGTKNIKETNIIDESENIKNVLHSISSLEMSAFIPIGNFMSLRLRNLSSLTLSPILKENELDYIGGLNTIRGFNEKSMPSSSFTILNTDIKYHFDKESAIFSFFDISYFEKRNTIIDSKDYALGTGLGLDLQTELGIFSIVYALGKHNKDPLSFASSKIHFGYKNIF